ncbi:Signal transduction histidine kinase [Nocardioides exalbidus]|uniref:histidine kinase n=1 Tax=Nocardioides exalbidus TaxID=402596 RepID=A0A1H4VZD1_9ACTN|nr:GAF domain-containing sensor histidine kinase [Nocardioides exalbidus]SEC86482.1 Signal transduction histidine kinase [Nocardioides exalbidus]
MDEVTERQHGPGRLRLDESTREHLEVLAEGAAALAEFSLAAISIRDADELEVVAAYGPGVSEAIVGRRLPVALLEAELAHSDEWGPWRFVPHDRETPEIAEYGYVSDDVVVDSPNAWHPRDLLAAPLLDDDGELVGVLSVDVPLDGLRPGKLQRELLEKCAVVTRRAALVALERMELAEQVRLAQQTRDIIRKALGEPTLALVLEASRSAIARCFDAFGMWLTTFDAQGGTSTSWYAEGAETDPLLDEVESGAALLAQRCWAEQRVAAFSRAQPDAVGLPPDEFDQLMRYLERMGIGSVLLVPLGAGTECLGFLSLTRISASQRWTDVELDAALDIGHDLGIAVANARQVDQLRRIDSYRTELVNTLAHELRNPLFTVAANLEMLEDSELEPFDQKMVTSASRGVARLSSVLEDLLTMARVADPHAVLEAEPVNLLEVLAIVEEECGSVAATKEVDFVVHPPSEPFLVSGSPDELVRMVCNLSGNAVKYTDAGGRVDVRLTRAGDEVVVAVQDTGIGISEDDQRQLFQEFFRSTNPDALERPGTGLGLAIVERIARRHSGRVELSSRAGEGTTVSVTLPLV